MDFTYPQISFEALNTPVSDWRLLFNYMAKHGLKTLFDAGAGNALSAQVAQSEFPTIHVTAWEIMASRITEVDCPRHDVRAADLMTEALPICDMTFIYLPTGPLLERILLQLPENSLIAAVESHGELFPRLEESAQLVHSIPITAQRHHSSMKIYRWHRPPDNLKSQLRALSTQDTNLQILIRSCDPFEGDAVWSADIFGLTITPDYYVETLFPPRRFELTKVIEITTPRWPHLISERRLGLWRKIIISPRQLKESPQGIRIEINET